jgi:hypothetical protein
VTGKRLCISVENFCITRTANYNLNAISRFFVGHMKNTIVLKTLQILVRPQYIALSLLLPVIVSIYRDISGHHTHRLTEYGYWIREEGIVVFLLLWLISLLVLAGFIQAKIDHNTP